MAPPTERVVLPSVRGVSPSGFLAYESRCERPRIFAISLSLAKQPSSQLYLQGIYVTVRLTQSSAPTFLFILRCSHGQAVGDGKRSIPDSSGSGEGGADNTVQTARIKVPSVRSSLEERHTGESVGRLSPSRRIKSGGDGMTRNKTPRRALSAADTDTGKVKAVGRVSRHKHLQEIDTMFAHVSILLGATPSYLFARFANRLGRALSVFSVSTLPFYFL